MFYGTSEYNGFSSYVFMDEKVREIRLPSKRRFKPSFERSGKADKIARKVNGWVFKGRMFCEEYDLWGTPFQRKACDIVRRIPPGFVMTYSAVAQKMGSGAYRAVGQAMARNPLPLLIPCHRVIASNLTLHDYGGGLWMKKKILEYEGVKFSGKRISPECLKKM